MVLLLLLSHHVPKTDPGMEKRKEGRKEKGAPPRMSDTDSLSANVTSP